MDILHIGNTFGIVSGIITSLGLLLGLYGAKVNVTIIIAGLLSIAISDSISDALGIYYASNNINDVNPYQESFYALIFKCLIPLLMIIPIKLFEIKKGIYLNIILGLIIIFYVSFVVFKSYNKAISNTVVCIVSIYITFKLGSLI